MFVTAGVAAVVVVAYLLFSLRTPATRPIADLPPKGWVCVEGTVRADTTLTTPLRGTVALAYQLLVERYRDERGQPADHFVALELTNFWIDDGTGGVQIDADSEAVRLVLGEPVFEPHYGKPTVAVWAALERAGADVNSELSRPDLAFAEQAITAGARVHVEGRLQREIDPHGAPADYRSPPERMLLSGSRHCPLVITLLED